MLLHSCLHQKCIIVARNLILFHFDKKSSAVTAIIIIFLIDLSSLPTVQSYETEESVSQRLRNALLANYDPRILPSKVTNGSAMTLLIDLTPRSFSVDEKASMFTLSGTLGMVWVDERLKWNPSVYENISLMTFSPDELWKPELTVFNDAAKRYFVSFHSVGLFAHAFDGVIWSPPSIFQTKCIHDLKKWPFDATQCVVRIGSWTVSGDDVYMISSSKPGGVTETATKFLIENGDWEVTKIDMLIRDKIFECCPSFQEFRIEWDIRRRWAHPFAIIFVPAIAIALIILTSFWIDPRSKKRMALILTSLMVNTMFLKYTATVIPPNGDDVPLAILYYRDSLAMIMVTLVWTMCSRYLTTIKRSTHHLDPVLKIFESGKWPSKVLCLEERPSPRSIRLTTKTEREGVVSNNIQETDQQNDEEGQSGGDPGSYFSNGGQQVIEEGNWAWLAHLMDRFVFFVYLITYVSFMIAFF